MDTDAKILNKILPNKLNSTLQESYTMTKQVYFRDAKMVHHM